MVYFLSKIDAKTFNLGQISISQILKILFVLYIIMNINVVNNCIFYFSETNDLSIVVIKVYFRA